MDRIEPRRPGGRQGAVGAVGDGRRLRAHTIAEAAMPGIAPIAGWLEVSKVDNGETLISRCADSDGQDLETEVEGWQTDRVREVLETDHYFHGCTSARVSDPSAQLCARSCRRRPRRRARASSRIRRRSRSIRRVRKRIATPPRGCAPAISCSPATSISARCCRVSSRRCCRSGAMHVTAPLGERLAEAITYRGAVTDSDGQRSLPHRRRRPADVGGLDHLGGAGRG